MARRVHAHGPLRARPWQSAAVLSSSLREAARRFPDRTVLHSADGWTVSYAELDRLADEVALGLADLGVGPGDVLALALPSTPEYVAAYVGAARLGAVTAGVNPSLAPAERGTLVQLAEARLVLATEALAAGLPAGTHAELVEVAGSVDGVLASLRVEGAPPQVCPTEDDLDAPVAIVFTSGTTGTPKGAVFTNRQLEAIVRIDVGVDTWDGGGPMLASTQFAHVGFMTKLPWYLRTGTTQVLLHRWRAGDALAAIAGHGMTSVGGVAPQIGLLLRHPDVDGTDLSRVKALIVGGGPSSPALIEEATRRFSAAYSVRYSSTESGGVGCGTAFDAPEAEALHTVGRPRPGIEAQIRDEDGRPVVEGEVGEVWLRSGATMARYWNDPEATAATLTEDGWLRTGDLGRVDERGCFVLVGRSKEMFIRGGYNVFPVEVEAVLGTHPGVADIAVAPRPDPVMGEVGVAVVVPADPAAPPTLGDLTSHADGKLAVWKLPEDLLVVEALPLTAMQKVDRRALAEQVSTGT
jgi:acyl-CoA synthetase (AMP-forming)/AMP-acid ligase II